MATKEFPLSVVIKGVDKVSGVLRGVQNKLSGFGTKIVSVNARLKAFGERSGLSNIGRAIGGVGSSLATLGKQAAMVGGLFAAMAAGGAAAAISLVQDFAATGSALNDTSISLGIGVEALQEYQFGARQTGVSNEELSKSLGILQKNLGNAFLGGGPALKFLEGAKIKLRGANKEMRSTEDLLPEIADKLAAIKSPALRAAAVTSVFGKSGLKLLPMLEGGSAGLKKFAERAREIGIVMSGKSVEAADKFGDAWDQLKDAISGAKYTIAAELLPVVNKLITQLTDFIIKNRPRIEAFFNDFAAKLPARIEAGIKAFNELRQDLEPVFAVVSKLNDKFGTSKLLIGVLAGVLMITLLPALVSCASAMWTLTAAMWSNPVGLAILLFAAWAAVVAYFALEVENGEVKLTKFGRLIWNISIIKQFYEINETLDRVKTNLDLMGQIVIAVFKRAAGAVLSFKNVLFTMTLPPWVNALLSLKGMNIGAKIMGGGGDGVGRPSAAETIGRRSAQPQEARIKIDMTNLPQGTKVSSETRGKPNLELNQGYALTQWGQ